MTKFIYANSVFKIKNKKEELTMSGHSKWHNIQAKKGKADAAKGKIFTKKLVDLIRLVILN